jgi:hypothetical protein
MTSSRAHFPKVFIRQAVRVLADVALVVGKWKIDQEDDRGERDEIQRELDEPFPAAPLRPVANPRRHAKKQQQRRDQQIRRVADDPEDIAAAVVAEGLPCGLGNLDPLRSSLGRCGWR